MPDPPFNVSEASETLYSWDQTTLFNVSRECPIGHFGKRTNPATVLANGHFGHFQGGG